MALDEGGKVWGNLGKKEFGEVDQRVKRGCRSEEVDIGRSRWF